MQIKTTTSHQSGWPSFISPQIPNAGGDVEKREPFSTVGGKNKLVQPLWRSVWRYLRKLYIDLPYVPATPLLGIYLDKTFLKKDICTRIFISAVITRAKTQKQPKRPSTDDWIKKMWYIYTQWNTTQT